MDESNQSDPGSGSEEGDDDGSQGKISKTNHDWSLNYTLVRSLLLPPFQIMGRFAFIRFIDVVMHLDIH